MNEFQELSEQHSAHEADQEQRLRAKSLLVSLFALIFVFVVSTLACLFANKFAVLEAATFGVGATGCFFVVSLGFKLTASAFIDGYSPFPKAMLLTVALSVLNLIALAGPLGVVASHVFLLPLLAVAVIALYPVTLLRAFVIAICGTLVGVFLILLVGGVAVHLIGR